MAQIDKLFTSIWHNTTTGPGTPLTGLSATITIRDKSTNTIVVNNQAMTEIGLGEYDYTFATMDATKPYSYVMNPNTTTAYVTSGYVDPRDAYIDKNVSDIASGGGGGFSSQAIQTSIGNLGRKMDKKIEDEHAITRELIKAENNETNSHIELAKTAVIDIIDGIEQAESVLEEKEAKKALKIVTSIDKKLSRYIDSEMKEREEIGSIAREFTRMDMEDAKKNKENEIQKKKMEEENDKKLLEDIKKEFDSQEEQEKEEKKKELEKELEETLKEAKEIEKELNSIK